MSQTPQNEKKSRFQLSREVQEEFVNGIAQTMLALAENAEQSQPSVAETPFCPVTGKEYSGANMVRLTLTAMEKGYDDNRWLTFKQLQAVREEHPDLHIRIRKGEHGVTVLRPEDVKLKPADDPVQGVPQGIVESLLFKGVHYEMKVRVGDSVLLVHSTHARPVGTRVKLTVAPEDIQVMRKSDYSPDILKRHAARA